MTPTKVRIFISSPGDVQEEREIARGVVQQLGRTFAGRLQLQAVLWEELPLSADASFQQGIDLVLSESGVDVAVFILWSRLGSPTGSLLVGNQGRQYRSGTEREWHLMLLAREEAARRGQEPRPAIIVYTKNDDVSFEERLRGKPDEQKALDLQQKLAVTQFIKEEFHDSKTGVNLRAFHSFDQPTTFAKQLRTHLTNLLESMFGQELDRPVWNSAEQGPPFRGLDVFEPEHSPIFFGREDEIVAIRNRLREQACRGCAFLLISGASGTGKSSLARAGVLPDICSHEVDAGIQKWRRLTVKPNQLGDDLLAGFVQALLGQDALPELAAWADDIALPKVSVESSTESEAQSYRMQEWLTRCVLRIKDGLDACDTKRGSTRLLVVIDQLEELFSSTALSSAEIEAFFQLLEALARSGRVWVLATVRSDFGHECQKVPALVRMKDGLAFDLVPPTPDALLRVVTGPAQLAGLKFEKEHEHSLADTILREAVGRSELLPLVEYLLLDLFEHRTPEDVLTYKRFRELGGVEGALRQRCETTFNELPAPVQAKLPAVLSKVVTLSGDDLNTAVRRTVPLERFKDDAEQRQLVDAMVRERLFTTSSDPDGTQVVSVAHEAVLRVWPRVTEWTDRNRTWLRIRSRVEQSQARWQAEQDDSLLLAQGVPLREATQLVEEAPHLLEAETLAFIERSQALQMAQTRRRKQLQLAGAAGAGLLCVLGFVIWGQTLAQQRRSRVEGLVAQLTTAEPARVPEIVQQLEAVHQLARPFITPLLESEAKTVDEQRAKLHAQLAVVGRDASMIDPLLEEMLTNKVAYIGPISELLQPHAATLTERLKAMLHDPQLEMKRRFRAAVALARFSDSTSIWEAQDLQFVAKQLVSENAEYQPILRDNLRTVSAQLLGPLEVLFKDTQAADALRLGAANALADFAANQSELLTLLLADATPEQYEVLYPFVAKAKSDAGITALKQIAAMLPPDALGTVERIGYGQRRANAAISLLRLGERETVLPVFDYTDDPEALTQFIFRCKPRSIGVKPLLGLLAISTRARSEGTKWDRARYALLLALGEYPLTDIPQSDRIALIQQLGDWYRHDPSSGIHGATGWLLRQWGEHDLVRSVDQMPVSYSPEREWFTMAIKTQSKPSSILDSVLGSPTKTFYYTFVVFPAGEYKVGSNSDEPERQKNELRHQVTLTRPFALLNREVTMEELIAFQKANADFMKHFDAKPVDGGFGAHWYDSVAFCRWLSIQAGLSESDQAYADPKSLDKAQYPSEPTPSENMFPRNWPLKLDRRGFRLPTETEWEVACRSSARTSYGYGSDLSLLGHFGWMSENSGKHVHPPQELRPGIRGIFDLHGNLFEWTHDWYGDYDAQSNGVDPLGIEGSSGRVYRGGSWGGDAASCRTALRYNNTPTIRTISIGFRLALSPSSP